MNTSSVETNTEPIKSRRPSSIFEIIYRVLLLILLVGILSVQIINMNNEAKRRELCDVQLSLVSKTIENMASEYEKSVYNNPDVDNINKQLFMVNEYQFLSQQFIAQLLTICR